MSASTNGHPILAVTRTKKSLAQVTFRHAAIYSFANLLGKAIGFILLPLYAHALGADGYGVIGMVDASISLLSSLLAYGYQNAITRFYHEQTDEQKLLTVSTGYWVNFGTSLILVGLALLGSPFLADLMLGSVDHTLLLCMAFLAFFMDMAIQAAGSILTIQQRSLTYSAFGLFRLICGIFFNIFFILWLEWGLYGYFLSSVLTSLFHFIVIQHFCFKKCGTGFNRDLAREMVRFQLPFIPGALISYASRQTERIILRVVESIEKVGVLEMAYKFPSLITLLIHQPFMTAWNTERIRLSQEDPVAAAKKIGDMFTLSLFSLVFFALLIALCIQDILILLTPREFWEAERIARIECITLVIACAVQHVSFGYLHQKDSKSWAMLNSVVSIGKIFFSVFFITWMGILGAAYSALLGAIVLLGFSLAGGQKRFAINYHHGINLMLVSAAFMIFFVTEWTADDLMRWAESLGAILMKTMALPPAIKGISLNDKLPILIDGALRATIGLSFALIFPLLRIKRPPTVTQ